MSKPKEFFLTSMLILILMVVISGCELALPTPIPGNSTVSEDQPTEVDHENNDPGIAVVTFYVEVPADTPPDEPILLSIVDEVTGLALNTKRYTMDEVEENQYVVGIPLTVGSTVKYRYSREGVVLSEEHTSNGLPVRYRLYHVEKPGETHDVITRWNDTPFAGSTGRITGVLTDSQSGIPIPGILVTAGGAHTLSNSDGSFLLEGLPPGTHTLVTYAMDGSYLTFQQGAQVAAESNTPASIQLAATTYVDISFLVQVPENTPPVVPLRMAGNLLQLGNTFADLSGGISTMAARMPVLSLLPDGSYGVILSLPVGADIRYKFTLGDGFWNAERSNDGAFVIRQLIVPDTPIVIEESIETWLSGDTAPITFDIIVPENTPIEEGVSIQFHPYGWTEPQRMWHLGDQRWAYILFSPLDIIDQLGYRYCRADQCGHADDDRTPGVFTSGQIIETSPDPLGLPDVIELWRWLESELPQVDVTDTPINPRGEAFMAGVELQTFYQPSMMPFMPYALDDITERGANWVIFTPRWSLTRTDPPVLQLVTGQDPLWPEAVTMIEQATKRDLNVAIRPVPHFPTAVEAWWSSAARDFPFWVSWFDQYRSFAIHHADLATRTGAKTLILGGAWMSPALPDGKLADGFPANTPQDTDYRYRVMLEEVREHFSGTLAWALPYSEAITNPPDFLDEIDQIYVLWSAPLSDDPSASTESLQAEAQRIINEEIYGMQLLWEPDSGQKSVILALAYPSVGGVLGSCLPDPFVDCLSPEALNFPAPDAPLLETNFVEQAKAYDAVLAAINQVDWIDGVVSRGYYPPAILHDKSTSVHGKPASDVIRYWYGQFLRDN